MKLPICPVWAPNKAWGPSSEAGTLDPYATTNFLIEALGRLTEEHVVSVLNRTVAYSYFFYIKELPASPFTTLYLDHNEIDDVRGRTEMECRWPWGDSRLYCIEYPLASIAQYKSGKPKAQPFCYDDPLKCVSFSIDTLLNNSFCSELIFCLEMWLKCGMQSPSARLGSSSELNADEVISSREALELLETSKATFKRWSDDAGVVSVAHGKWRKSDIELLKVTKGTSRIRHDKNGS